MSKNDIEFHEACMGCVESVGSARIAPAPHNLKTCSECGALIDASEAGQHIDIYVCPDCDAGYIFPPGVTRAACPFVFSCVKCGSFTEYDSETDRYSCANSGCDNFNCMKRPEDIVFGDYYEDSLSD